MVVRERVVRNRRARNTARRRAPVLSRAAARDALRALSTRLVWAARHPASPRVAIVLVCTALVAGAYAFATTTRVFALRDIEVRGNAHVATADILSALPFATGQNTLRADVDAAEEVIASHPWIASAHVHRELPNRVVVDVVERVAAGAVHVGSVYLVDADGVLFKTADGDEAKDLPLITGFDRASVRSHGATTQIAGALRLVAKWRERGLPRVGEIALAKTGHLTFVTEHGARIALGVADETGFADRLVRVQTALTALTPEEQGQVRSLHLGESTPRVVVALTRNPNGQTQEQ